jgi:hypothetical protein
MDPFHTESVPGQTRRIGLLQSMNRVRVLLTTMVSQTRRVNLSGGIYIGAWKPLCHAKEFDLSSFACYEFLECMKRGVDHSSQPERWALEKLAR